MSTTPGKAAISLSTGLEDAERVTVAFLMAVGVLQAGGEADRGLAGGGAHLVLLRR